MNGSQQLLVGKVLKGLYAATMACLGSLATVLGDDVTIEHLTAGQWVTIAAFTIGAFGGTFGLSGWAGPGGGGIAGKGPKGG